MQITAITFRALPDTQKIQGKIIFDDGEGRAVKVYATPVPKEGRHIDPETNEFAKGFSPDYPVFVLTASVVDPETGQAFDHPATPNEKAVWWGLPVSVSIGQADGSLPVVCDPEQDPKHGEIKIEDGRLFLCVSGTWVDVGPIIKADQSRAVSKLQIAIVTKAREMVDSALQAYDEAQVWPDLMSLTTEGAV